MLWFSVVCCSTTSTTQSLQNKEVWVSLNVVKKPKSYWGKGNTVYEVSKVTFTSLMFHPFNFSGKEAKMHGDSFICQIFLLVGCFVFCSEQSFLLGGQSPSREPFYGRPSSCTSCPGVELALQSTPWWSDQIHSCTHPKLCFYVFFLRNCPSPAPKPFQRAAPTLFNFSLALTNSE